MKANYLVSSLCLAPLALAAPLSRTTILVSAKAVWKQAHEQASAVTIHGKEAMGVIFGEHTTPTTKETPSEVSNSDRPMTTKELMELAKAQSFKPKETKATGTKKVSVGALVIPGRPGVIATLFDPESGSPYLIPGQYVVKQRADLLIVGMILTCAFLVALMEGWAFIVSLVKGTFRRNRSSRIHLSDSKDLEAILEEDEDDEDSDDEDDCDAPFGGFSHSRRTRSSSLRLPDKMGEKTSWI